jgi:hypothetical protein
MPDLTYYRGRWIAIGEDGSVAAVGESLEEARQVGIQARPRSRLTLAWVSPYPPYVMLPEWPLTALQAIDSQATTWLAGGPVRDLLLGRAPHDWDFVTDGSGLKLARAVANALGGAYYALDTERGTGRAIVVQPGSHTAITLDFAQLRGPTIEADLWERDFTLNSMALTLDGQLVDPTGGRFDLEARLLRMTKPSAFEDDPARLLRAVRLATQFDFALEPETIARLRSQPQTLQEIASERVRQELVKLLAHPRARLGLEQLSQHGLLPFVLPEVVQAEAYPAARERAFALVQILHDLDRRLRGKQAPHGSPAPAYPHGAPPSWAWQSLSSVLARHQRDVLAYLNEPAGADVTRADLLKWSALFCPFAPGEQPLAAAQQAEVRLEALRFSGNSISFVVALLRCLRNFEDLAVRGFEPGSGPLPDREIYRYYRAAGSSGAGIGTTLLALTRLLVLQGSRLDRGAWMRHLTTAAALLHAYFDRRDVVIDPPRLLTGRDLMALGLAQGPAIGQTLEVLREAQAAGEITTREEAVTYVQDQIQTRRTLEEANHAHDA